MGLQHTSVPRWPTADPGVDRTGRAYAVMSFGPDAAPVAAGWQRELHAIGRPVWSWHGEAATDEGLAAIHQQVESATVGWRLMLVGPQCDVLRAHAEALAGGVLEAEVTVLVTDQSGTRVWCAHCGATTLADAAIGEVTGCSGCGQSLYVYHHVSRRSGTHLGFMVDAEELG